VPREIMTVSEMSAADRAAVARGVPTTTLMERAGIAVAEAVRARFSHRPVVIWCGPGDNGGDGYVVARHLRRKGWSVRVEVSAPPRTEAAKAAAARWKGETALLPSEPTRADLYIDALFGAGLSRPLEGDVAKLARAVVELGRPIVAIDTPSGIAGDTGRALGEAAFHADLTVTFHRRKLAHALIEGRKACGDIVVADIGLGLSLDPITLHENTPSLWGARFPWPALDAHKHRRGRLKIVSGDAWSTGAARLAARGGLRIGAGVVTVLSPPAALTVNAANLEAVMLSLFEGEADLEAAGEGADAVVIGPAAGVGEATARNLFALARTGAALVIDADALTSFRHDPGALFSALDRDDVLTPHPGEFERIFPGLLAGSPERVSATRCGCGETGRRTRFRFWRREAWRFESSHPHHFAGPAPGGGAPLIGTFGPVRAPMPLDGRQTRDIRALFRRPGDVGGFDVLTPGADDGRGRPKSREAKNVDADR
jgi:hydroxyethylthiazole kinase-like uncharacterized protein yjeF